MVNEIMLGAFQDELEKIARSRHYRHLPLSRAELQKLANLARYVDAAKSGRYLSALTDLARDRKAQTEAFTRFQKLKGSGNLPKTLQDAPVPSKLPKGIIPTAKAQAGLLAWLKKNKDAPGFKQDARLALDRAMALAV